MDENAHRFEMVSSNRSVPFLIASPAGGGIEAISENPLLYAPFLLLICLTVVVGTGGNILQLVAMYRSNHFQNPDHVLVANSAAGEGLAAIFTNGFTLIGLLQGDVVYLQQPVFCQLTGAVSFVAWAGALYTLMAIAINRYTKVCRIHLYKRIFTHRKTVAICIANWLLAVASSSLPLVGFGRYAFDPKALTCMIDRTFSLPVSVSAVVALMLLPGSVSAFCYTRIFVYVRESRRRSVRDDANGARKRRGDNSLTKTLFVITVMYFVSLSPVCFVFIADHWDTLPQWPYMYALGLAYTKAAVDPIVFGVTSKSLRRRYVDMLGLRRCRKADAGDLITANEATTYAPSTRVQSNTDDEDDGEHE